MSRIHQLMQPIEGCTHTEEGQVVLRRQGEADGLIEHRVELRGGIMVKRDAADPDKRDFVPQYPSGRPTPWDELSTNGWTAARHADFIEFQALCDADPEQAARPLLERAVGCMLAYHQLLQVGERPVAEPEPLPTPEPDPAPEP